VDGATRAVPGDDALTDLVYPRRPLPLEPLPQIRGKSVPGDPPFEVVDLGERREQPVPRACAVVGVGRADAEVRPEDRPVVGHRLHSGTEVPVRILLPVDVGEEADRLADQAATWAEKLSATVDLLHCEELPIPLPRVQDASVQAVIAQHWTAMREARAARVEALSRRIPEARRGTAKVALGSAPAGIAEAAKGYDLVLLGTHGRKGLERLWLGSVAEQVVRTCPVPVLVLRLNP
jgi:nucleotide-binding universal stress UspA family protein